MATTETSIKAYLDSLSQLPGSILYRDEINWQALPPGNAGQILQVGPDLLPAWTARRTFQPALMRYDGATTGYDNQVVPLTNAAITIIFRFTITSQTTNHRIWNFRANASGYTEGFIAGTGQFDITVRNSANAVICQIQSLQNVQDGLPHYGFFTFTPSTAALVYKIDGQDADDTSWPSRILTTGTLGADATGDVRVGHHPTAPRFWPENIGAFGFKNTNLLTWSDFMDEYGWPKPIDTTSWTQWLGQPPIWHESGQLDFNRGSAGAFTKTGPIKLANPLEWD